MEYIEGVVTDILALIEGGAIKPTHSDASEWKAKTPVSTPGKNQEWEGGEKEGIPPCPQNRPEFTKECMPLRQKHLDFTKDGMRI